VLPQHDRGAQVERQGPKHRAVIREDRGRRVVEVERFELAVNHLLDGFYVLRVKLNPLDGLLFVAGEQDAGYHGTTSFRPWDCV
jgi:hypothetical protein